MTPNQIRREFEDDWRSFRPFLKQDLQCGRLESYKYRISKMKSSMMNAGVTKYYIANNLKSHLDHLEAEVKREQRLRMNA